MKRFIVIGILILLLCSGCNTLKKSWKSLFGANLAESAQMLAWDGMDAYEDGDFTKAIANFQQLKDWYPFSKYAIEAIPYVIYQIGRCYFDQIDTIDRDQTPARKAYETFQRLNKQFPDDKYARSGLEHISTCLKSLAGNEYYVGIFYYKSNHYKAALHRFMSVLSNYPDVGYHQLALEYIAKCEAELATEGEIEVN
jgi:outer membrane protein assembly factor BamD